MKIKGKISIFIGGRDNTRILIEDADASIRFAEVTLTHEQLSRALSREGLVECEIEVVGLDKVGKKMEWQTFEFEIPERMTSSHGLKLKEIADSLLSDGWEAESYFGSKSSFFERDGKFYARATIRRYV